jgi:hypothetical protein
MPCAKSVRMYGDQFLANFTMLHIYNNEIKILKDQPVHDSLYIKYDTF